MLFSRRVNRAIISQALQEDKTERHNFKEILLKLVTEIESFLGQVAILINISFWWCTFLPQPLEIFCLILNQKIFEAGSCLTSQDSSQLLQKARKVLETVFSTPLPLHLIDILETTTEEVCIHSPNKLKSWSSIDITLFFRCFMTQTLHCGLLARRWNVTNLFLNMLVKTKNPKSLSSSKKAAPVLHWERAKWVPKRRNKSCCICFEEIRNYRYCAEHCYLLVCKAWLRFARIYACFIMFLFSSEECRRG